MLGMMAVMMISCSNDISRLNKGDDSLAGIDKDTVGSDTAAKPDQPGGNDGTVTEGSMQDVDMVGVDTSIKPEGETNDSDTPASDTPVGNDDAAVDTNPSVDTVVTPDVDQVVSKLCTDNGGTCVNSGPGPVACPEGSQADSRFQCEGNPFPGTCCMPGTTTGLSIEVTGPTPVPENLKNIPAVYPTATQAGNTPELTGDLSGPMVVVGLLESGNTDGCDAYKFELAKGAIVLVARGSCQFTQKVTNAANAGAAAIVVYNNQSGSASGWNATGSIPMLSIEQAAGNTLTEFAKANPAITVTLHP